MDKNSVEGKAFMDWKKRQVSLLRKEAGEAAAIAEEKGRLHEEAMAGLAGMLSKTFIGDVIEVLEDGWDFKKGQRFVVVKHVSAEETADGWEWCIEVDRLTKKGEPHATRNSEPFFSTTKFKVVKRGGE